MADSNGTRILAQGRQVWLNVRCLFFEIQSQPFPKEFALKGLDRLPRHRPRESNRGRRIAAQKHQPSKQRRDLLKASLEPFCGTFAVPFSGVLDRAS